MTDGSGLEDAYGATLGRIKKQGEEKARLGMAALMWISHAERPLKADELCHALAIEIGSPNLNIDDVPSIGTLLACCQGLVVVEKEASTVRLIHFTLQEFLRARPHLFGPAHATITEACLTYLNSQQVKALSTSPSPDLQDTPFLEYCSIYWGAHAKRDLSDYAKLLALKLFDDYDCHISTKILMKTQNLWGLKVVKYSGFTGLHCVSVFGIDEFVVDLLEVGGCDPNQTDFASRTPISRAARNKHEGVVKALLGRDGIDPYKPDHFGEMPLHAAAAVGCEGVVKVLLEQDGVNPGEQDSIGRTPLYLAAGCGREEIVKILLKRDDVNPDKPNYRGQTPLWAAAEGGHEGVVKLLLQRDEVNPDKPDEAGRTPFWWAACCGHEGVVKILLGQDVNRDKLNINGRTPL